MFECEFKILVVMHLAVRSINYRKREIAFE